ncbi:tetratricopeptide repeat protein [Evansella halocellulosilytica]|uniref:tetratricopeptide repeat protein n=1 Tax=Evansella halocellulosilytica TaxID=2011013 RepID=UPI00211C6D38|nr:tetratricopeptide repeat protein [Evansella halocellulosilytica]
MMLHKARRLIEENKNEEAKQLLLDLTKEYPNDKQVHFHCAEVHDGLGLEREAITHYEKALALGILGEERERAFIQLGSSLRCIGQYDEAMNILKAGLKEFPENRALHVFLAMTFYNVNDHKLAVETLLSELIETSSDQWINKYSRALTFYSENLDKTW